MISRWIQFWALIALLGMSCPACNRAGREADETARADDPSPASDDESEEAEADGPKREYYPLVVLRTGLGNLTLKLDPQRAPRTVNNFLYYVSCGHYNHTIFHYVDADYLILGGSFTTDLEEKEGRYTIRNEADNGLKNRRATIAMARQPDDIDGSTCQFFINLRDNPELDHHGDSPEEFGYCVFGEVVEGLETLGAIARVKVHETGEFEKLPLETVMIESAERVR